MKKFILLILLLLPVLGYSQNMTNQQIRELILAQQQAIRMAIEANKGAIAQRDAAVANLTTTKADLDMATVENNVLQAKVFEQSQKLNTLEVEKADLQIALKSAHLDTAKARVHEGWAWICVAALSLFIIAYLMCKFYFRLSFL